MAECNLRDGFACLGGIEIWNVCRTLAYVDALMPHPGFSLNVTKNQSGDFCCGCCDGVYVSPVLDEAPWYDANNAVSGGFYGILPTTIDGLSTNPTARAVSPGVGGASFSRRFEAGKTIDVTALAYADSCDAMDWGLAWLNATLERDCGSSGFAWQACCPAPVGSESGSGNPLDHGLRVIPCVALTTGLDAETFNPETFHGLVYEVTFTLSSEQSWIYDAPVELVSEVIQPGAGFVCAEYSPDCIDGAAIEVFIDRSRNSGYGTDILMLANPTLHLPAPTLDDPGALLTIANARYGATVEARPGDSLLLDPRCNNAAIVGPTGAILRPMDHVNLSHNARGLFPIAYYGDDWRICVSVPDNTSGPVSVTIRAHPRRRF